MTRAISGHHPHEKPCTQCGRSCRRASGVCSHCHGTERPGQHAATVASGMVQADWCAERPYPCLSCLLRGVAVPQTQCPRCLVECPGYTVRRSPKGDRKPLALDRIIGVGA